MWFLSGTVVAVILVALMLACLAAVVCGILLMQVRGRVWSPPFTSCARAVCRARPSMRRCVFCTERFGGNFLGTRVWVGARAGVLQFAQCDAVGALSVRGLAMGNEWMECVIVINTFHQGQVCGEGG